MVANRRSSFVGVVILALAVMVSACGGGGNGITSPTNLNSVPPGAFQVSDGKVTVQFWFELAPGSGAVVGPGDSVTLYKKCRVSSGERYMLTIDLTSVAPNGKTSPGFFGAGGGSVSTADTCGSGGMWYTTVTLGRDQFQGIQELRGTAALHPGDSSAPATAATSFSQPVGWAPRQ